MVPVRSDASILLQGRDRLAVVEGDPEDVALLVDLGVEPGRQRVDHGRADAVQATGHLVAAAAELAAGVQLGEHELDRGLALGRVDVGGDAATVVGDADAAVGEQRHVDGVGVAGQRLVDGVVDDLPDQVVQAALTGGADVHAGALAHRLEALEDGDLAGVVLGPGRGAGQLGLDLPASSLGLGGREVLGGVVGGRGIRGWRGRLGWSAGVLSASDTVLLFRRRCALAGVPPRLAAPCSWHATSLETSWPRIHLPVYWSRGVRSTVRRPWKPDLAEKSALHVSGVRLPTPQGPISAFLVRTARRAYGRAGRLPLRDWSGARAVRWNRPRTGSGMPCSGTVTS